MRSTRKVRGGSAATIARKDVNQTEGRTVRTPLLAISMFSAALLARPVQAAPVHFISSNGAWGSFGNWNPSRVPLPADDAIVDFFNGSPGRATVNVDVGAVTSASISNGDTVAFLNGGTLLVGSGGVFVGKNNTAGILTLINPNPINFYQAGVTVTGPLHVGYLSGVGTISQNDGTVTLASGLYIGSDPDTTSAFGSAGTYNFGGAGWLKGIDIHVGGASRSVGTFNISGGNVTANELHAGFSGAGFINQSAGKVTISQEIDLESPIASAYTLSGGFLTCPYLNLSGAAPVFNYNGGTLSLGNVNFVIHDCRLNVLAGTHKVLSISSLRMGDPNFEVAGVVDLNDNSMTMPNSQANRTQVLRDLRSAYNNGAWNGQGITSTVAANSPTHSTALGYDSRFSLVVKYTYYGDSDLNGIIDFDDYAHIDNGFNTGGSDWLHGDFDYNGHVDFDDFSLIDRAFNTQSGTLRRAMAYLDGSDRGDDGMNQPALRLVQQHFARFGDVYATSFLSGVPEPGALTLLALGPILFRRRR